jgi:ABC-type uncharacterized transport system involved in gliding motility auxiliary subunit
MMFVLNAIDYLLKDVSLNEVRSRTIPNSPLDITRWLYRRNIDAQTTANIEPRIRQFVKLVNLLLPSLLLVVMGLVMLFRLRKSRCAIQAGYNDIPVEAPPEASNNGDEQV